MGLVSPGESLGYKTQSLLRVTVTDIPYSHTGCYKQSIVKIRGRISRERLPRRGDIQVGPGKVNGKRRWYVEVTVNIILQEQRVWKSVICLGNLHIVHMTKI